MTDATEWQPIDTVPTDGRLVLMWSEKFGYCVGNQPPAPDGENWERARGIWTQLRENVWAGNWTVAAEDATHWHPLPAPPTDAAPQRDLT